MIAASNRLRRHGDFQRVYKSSSKRFSKQMSYFFLLRAPEISKTVGNLPQAGVAPRVGLTVGRVMGKAVDRNRIKRRMREAVRARMFLLRAPVDVVLHPQRRVRDAEFSLLESEVGRVFEVIQQATERRDGRGDPLKQRTRT